MNELLPYLNSQLQAMTDLLADLVNIESPTDDKAGVDRVGQTIARELRGLGADVRTYTQHEVGDHVLGVLGKGRGSPIAMILHMDTVHPVGTLATRPVRVADGLLYGPGSYDMKGSHVIALYAIRALKTLNILPEREIRLLFTSDEETGSHRSQTHIEDIARNCSLAMVMEPALPDGRLKSARKGVGEFRVTVRGRASHAGAEHEKGINAIHELSHQVIKLQSLTDYQRGVTFSVGEIRGGGAVNVVPDYASLVVDTRVTTLADAAWVRDAIYGLKPHFPGAILEVEGDFNRPPMECDEQRLQAFRQVHDIGLTLGIDIQHGPSGGGSDASYTAAIRVPTLDGFGAVGDGAHAVHEHVVLASLAERAALCAAVLRSYPH